MAVPLSATLLESSFVQLLQAGGTHKMLRVELLVHGRDAATCHWLVAVRAQRPSLGMIVGLAVRKAIVFIKTACAE